MGAHQQCMMAQSISGGSSYLASEDFEGTGTPSGWTAVGSPNFDYATSPAPLLGAQSLLSSTASNYGYYDLGSDLTDFWVFFTFTLPDISLNPYCLRILDSAGATVIGVRITSTGAYRVTNVTTTAATGTAGAFANGNVRYCWAHFVEAGAGASSAEIYMAATETRPGSASGTDGVTASSQTWAGGLRRVAFTPGATTNLIVDKVRISASSIGNSPT